MGKEYHNYLAKLKMYLLHKPTIPQNDLSHAHTHTLKNMKKDTQCCMCVIVKEIRKSRCPSVGRKLG